jgi:RimJ/RimL family protein N-acetyltransferase
MVTITYIDKKHRLSNSKLIEEITEAIFGNPTEIAFSEEHIPVNGRVPFPKKEKFKGYLLDFPELLWAIQFNGKTIGFLLVSDMPFKNAVGFSINSAYSKKGVATTAFELAKAEGRFTYSLYGYTSVNNIPAQRLLIRCGFEQVHDTVNFMGQDSFKFKLD